MGDNVNEVVKKAGRPVEGITEEKARYYYWKIDSWIKTDNLAKWLFDPEAAIESAQAFKKITLNRKNTLKLLNQWREDWLSQEGWERLQANVRQQLYTQGRPTHDDRSRERKKAVSLKASTATDLKFFAESRGMTIDQAVLYLLKYQPKANRK